MAWQYQSQLDEAARVATRALKEVSESIATGVLLQEPEMNGAVASHLASAFRNKPIGGVKWNCRHLTSIGSGAEENVLGADLIISIEISLPKYSTKKGLLIQNKRHDRRGSNERKRLLDQIEKMEQVTSSPWVGVLSGTQIRFDSARTVKGRNGSFSRDEARIPPLTFFKDFFVVKLGMTPSPHNRPWSYIGCQMPLSKL